MKLEYIPFKAKGETTFNQVFGIWTFACVLFVTIGLALFSEKLIGNIIGVALSILVFIILRKVIRKVEFTVAEITVTYLYGNQKTVQYDQIKKFYKNREGFLPIYVYVVKYQDDNRTTKLKKFTFWKDDLNIELLKSDILTVNKRV
jgi:hypothetical protein